MGRAKITSSYGHIHRSCLWGWKGYHPTHGRSTVMPACSLQDFLFCEQVPPNSIWLNKISSCCPRQYWSISRIHCLATHPSQVFPCNTPALHTCPPLFSSHHLSISKAWGLYFCQTNICFILGTFDVECEDSGYHLTFAQGLYLSSGPCVWSLPELHCVHVCAWPCPPLSPCSCLSLSESAHTQDTKPRRGWDLLTCLLCEISANLWNKESSYALSP